MKDVHRSLRAARPEGMCSPSSDEYSSDIFRADPPVRVDIGFCAFDSVLPTCQHRVLRATLQLGSLTTGNGCPMITQFVSPLLRN